jgi:hypothetical protein
MNPLALFGLSALASFVSSVVAARFIVWPQLQESDRNQALTWLVAPHMFLRFVGLSVLVPGVVSPLLPAGFAVPVAYGDLIAGVLAIVAVIGLAGKSSWAISSVWLFNIWGTADFLLAFYEGPHVGLQPGMLGAAFFIVTAVVPPLLTTHALIFRLLASRQSATNHNRSPQLGQTSVARQSVR